MKKIIFTLLILTGLTVGVKAQDDAKLWIGGSVGLNTYKIKDADGSAKNFQIAPEIGYNFSDSWAVGMAIGYKHFDEGPGLDQGNGFTINPFARFTYFKRDLASLFVDGGFAFTTLHTNGVEDNDNQFEIGFKPGVAFNIAPNVKLLAKVGFLGYTNYSWGDDEGASQFDLKLDLSQIQLGVNFLF